MWGANEKQSFRIKCEETREVNIKFSDFHCPIEFNANLNIIIKKGVMHLRIY